MQKKSGKIKDSSFKNLGGDRLLVDFKSLQKN